MTVTGPTRSAPPAAPADPVAAPVVWSDMTISFSGPGQATVAVTGEVDACNADRLRLAILGAAGMHGAQVEVDLTGVTFMDSAALSAIAEAALLLGSPRAGLVLCNVPRQVQRILAIIDPGRRIEVRA
jgi:anti-sigma B factor antagonist